MSCRKLFVFLFIFFIPMSFIFSVEKWNVLVLQWKDLSVKKDKSIGLTIRKSISLMLQKEKDFALASDEGLEGIIENYNQAVETGRKVKADVVIYGEYYIEGENLLVSTEVFDVLEKQLKMRKVYTGKITADIFDTIEEMSADMLKKIKEVLPSFTTESETRIKKIRETVYQTEEIKVKRLFYTRFGIFTEFGNKKMGWELDSTYPKYYEGNIPMSVVTFGFAFRYWDFRVDLLIGGLPGTPFYDGRKNVLTAGGETLMPVTFGLSYYLPWFDNTIAIGLGAMDVQKIVAIYTNDIANEYEKKSVESFPLALFMTWNPYSFWEIGLIVGLIFNSTRVETTLEGEKKTIIKQDFPPLNISTIYFFGDFGVEARVHLELHGKYEEYWNNNLRRSTTYDVLGLYLGMVYKVDFLSK